jgi:arylsulfatase A-like enzyme
LSSANVDHGFHLGEFRMPMFKCQPYDTDITVPFFIRGPGIQPGRVITDKIGLNIDVAPTIAALVYTAPPAEALIDGRSLTPLIFTEDAQEQAQHPAAQNNAAASTADEWRTDFLFEFWAGGAPGGKVAREYLCDHVMMSPNNTYAGMLPACSLDSLVVCVF